MVAPRTILALFALLLTATHCVDIDDRDLDVSDDDGTGGGSGTTCEPQAADNDCTLCTKAACCDELTTCDQNLDCVYFFDCWLDCPDDACVAQYCVEEYPGGEQDFADFLDCTFTQCFDVCS